MPRSSVNGRLFRSPFCYGTEAAPMQCKRSLGRLAPLRLSMSENKRGFRMLCFIEKIPLWEIRMDFTF